MERESESIPNPWRVTAVHWDCLERRITVTTSALRTEFRFREGNWTLALDVRDPAAQRRLLQLCMTELTGVGVPDLGDIVESPSDTLEQDPEVVAPSPGVVPETDRGSSVKSPTVILAGKLQTIPREGRPDRQGKPTAWARFLAHIEGRDGATQLSTSFHGRTREIALALPQDAPITAQGYLHLGDDADPDNRRLSSFSVIHLLQYPGKQTS